MKKAVRKTMEEAVFLVRYSFYMLFEYYLTHDYQFYFKERI
jgi:hypothetical protein